MCVLYKKKGIQERVRIFLVAYVTHPMLVYFFLYFDLFKNEPVRQGTEGSFILENVIL